MKRNVLVVLGILIIVICTLTIPAAAYWNITLIDDNYGPNGNGNPIFPTSTRSIVAEQSGKIAIVYQVGSGSGSKIYFAELGQNGEWSTQKLADGFDPTIAIDSEDTLHIAYIENNRHVLKYTYRTLKTGWGSESANISSNYFAYPSIAIDPVTYQPRICANEFITSFGTLSSRLLYSEKRGGNWYNNLIQVTPTYEAEPHFVDSRPVMAIDSQRRPHIIFNERQHSSDGGVYYIYNDGSKWVNKKKLEGNTEVKYLSIVISPVTDLPSICYSDDNTLNDQSSLVYGEKNTAGDWSVNNIIGWGHISGPGCSLALDSSGRPYISYYYASSRTSPAQIRYTYRDPAGWHTNTAAYLDNYGLLLINSLSPSTSLTFDSYGKPSIAYYNGKPAHFPGSGLSVARTISAPNVTGAEPFTGNVGTTVNPFHVYGTGFELGATVILSPSSGPVEIKYPRVVRVSPTELTVVLSIPAQQKTGLTVLRVRNPDGQYGENSSFFILPIDANPSQGKIAFVTDRVGIDVVGVMNVDGSGQHRLSQNTGISSDPAFSPDGSRIAYTVDGQIVVMRADGRVVDRMTTKGGFDPAWSPDGTKIAYINSSCEPGMMCINPGYSLCVMNADGTGKYRIYPTDTKLEHPTWSPEGLHIAFSEKGNIYVIKLGETQATQITSSGNFRNPSWSPSPDSLYIAAEMGSNIVLIPTKSGVTKTLYKGGYEPSWSSYGSKIAFTSGFSNKDIFVMNRDGTGVTRLTTDPADDSQPSWGPIMTPIIITHPNGGETWQRGSTHIITWDYTGSPGSYVKIVLLKAGTEVGTITANTSIGSSGYGSYQWAISPTGSTGSDYKVLVQSISQPSIKDASNNYFTLTPAPPTIRVTSPNGGESWQQGTLHDITWSYTGDPGSTVKIVLIEDISTGIPKITTIADNVPIRSIPIVTGKYGGSYSWTIPSNQALGTKYKIAIQSTSQPAINDVSDNYFRIISGTTTPSITVTVPNGGESWQRGTTHTVTWNYTGSPGSDVKIILLRGVTNTEVGTIIPSTPIGNSGKGSYTWPIASSGTTGSDFKVRVESLSQPTINDTSNNIFTLTPAGTAAPSITVTAPDGGETWQRGTTHTVLWSYTGTPGTTVKLVLVKAGTDVGTIIASTPLGTSGTGSFTWPIASSGTTGSDFKLRVESLSQPTINDTSNNIFTLTL